jgi:hypothetical protein
LAGTPNAVYYDLVEVLDEDATTFTDAFKQQAVRWRCTDLRDKMSTI